MRPTSASVEWIFLATYLVLEILSAACDQASSPRRPHFALFGMLLAIAAAFISIGELIYRGKRERVEFRSRGMRSWFYHPPIPPYTPFGTLPDIYGFVAGISQCICSIVQYVYCLRHADSPLKASLLPAIFLMCLVGSRLSNKRMNANTSSTEETLLNPDPENNAPANTPSLDNQEVEEQEQERQLRRQLPQEQERQLRRRLPREQERRLQQRERLWQLQEQEQEQKQEQERQVREQEQEQLQLQLQQLQEQEEERQLQEQEQERQVREQEQERLLLRQRQLQEQEEEQRQRQRRQRQLQEQGQEQLQLRLQEQKWWSGES